MMDRLALPMLLAGCVLLAAIVAAEVEPRPGGEQADAIATSPPSDLPPAPARVRSDPSGRYEALLETSLARPLFSSTRRPPPPGGPDDATDSGLADTRLTGIVTEPGHRIAIFVPAGAKPLTVSEGETVSGWRVENITPREVSLSGPGGIKTLQPKFDPNLAPPPEPPAPAANLPARPGGRALAPLPAVTRPPTFANRPPPRPGRPRGQR